MMQIAFADLSQCRCHFLKPDLTKEFKTLCAVDNSVTSKLFCDDLDKHINEITNARQLSRKIVHSIEYRETIGNICPLTDKNHHY